MPSQQPFDMQYFQSKEDINTGGIPQDIMDLEQNIGF
jgi:hypothetical protein